MTETMRSGPPQHTRQPLAITDHMTNSVSPGHLPPNRPAATNHPIAAASPASYSDPTCPQSPSHGTPLAHSPAWAAPQSPDRGHQLEREGPHLARLPKSTPRQRVHAHSPPGPGTTEAKGSLTCLWGWILGLHNGGAEFKIIIVGDAIHTLFQTEKVEAEPEPSSSWLLLKP